MHRDEWDDEDEEPASAAAPLTTKEKDLLRYYYYIHNGIDTRWVCSIKSAVFLLASGTNPIKLFSSFSNFWYQDWVFVTYSKISFIIKWHSLTPKNGKDLCFVSEEKKVYRIGHWRIKSVSLKKLFNLKVQYTKGAIKESFYEYEGLLKCR